MELAFAAAWSKQVMTIELAASRSRCIIGSNTKMGRAPFSNSRSHIEILQVPDHSRFDSTLLSLKASVIDKLLVLSCLEVPLHRYLRNFVDYEQNLHKSIATTAQGC